MPFESQIIARLAEVEAGARKAKADIPLLRGQQRHVEAHEEEMRYDIYSALASELRWVLNQGDSRF